MPPVSAVILTLNEEHNIGRCIDSVMGVAEEILVVDSFSTDRTAEICREKGARFIQHKFPGYIEQKNYALAQATFPHVLSLDADEALSDALRNSILKVKEKWDKDGYSMNRLTNYCGKWIRHGSWYPDVKLRLFDKRKAQWGGINPHDIVILSAGSAAAHIKGDILHYSYYSISEHIKQIDHFSGISARALYDKGVKSSLFHLVVRPPFRFFRDYFIKLGFLDGFYGLVVCCNTAHSTFLKYAKLRQMERDSK